MARRLFWSLLVGIAICVAILIAQSGDDPITSLLRHDVASIAPKAGIVAFGGGLVALLFRERVTQALEALLFWAIIVVVLFVGYAYRIELGEAGDRMMAELVPGHAVTHGRTVEIVRGGGGDFAVHTTINGAKVAMVLDTGATSVVLTKDAAKAAGLPIDMLAYTVTVDTANGRTRAAPVTLDRLAVGGLTERQVPALVVQSSDLKNNLLGMSFLNRLESWEVHGDKLRLRGTS